MNNLITDFKSLCTSNITLPDSGDITVEHLNVNFQNNLYQKIKNNGNHIRVTLEYIQYLNNHILSFNKEKQFTYKDKLYLLNHWRIDVTYDENPISYDFILKSLERIISVYGISLNQQVQYYIKDYIIVHTHIIMRIDVYVSLKS